MALTRTRAGAKLLPLMSIDPSYLDRNLTARIMARDAQRCAKLQRDIARRRGRKQATDQLEEKLLRLVDGSRTEFERRCQSVPALHYPPELPVSEQRQQILDAMAQHQVVIVAGATGSGKTTQLPKLCLELGYGTRGRIGHTQPRRIAARTVAARIADELGTTVGELLGYQVRFADHCSDRTLVKLMTDGILLSEIQRDRYLEQYDALIIDEAHERSLNIDFLLGYLKNLLPRRPDLKLVVTSATIDVARFSQHFSDAPVIDVSGRSWPVDVQYCEPGDALRDAGLPAQVLDACQQILDLERAGAGQGAGDILVFLPGERDIRECALHLRNGEGLPWDILPLYSRLGQAEQNRVFDSRSRRGRRVVLATNVAETSLTVPGIRYVIDSGVARISRYSHRSRVQRLPIEAISQASALQRSGRCGREAPGTCLRLYSEEDFLLRPEYTDSEIHRTNLASVILQLKRMHFGDIDDFPFIEPPDSRMVKDGFALLQELGATDAKGALTHEGKLLAKIPADPRIARMLLAAQQFACLDEVLIIAAGLSIQDPRERPMEKQQAADQAHSRFAHPGSDFFGYISLWRYFEQQRQQLSKNQMRKLCRKEFLSWTRLFEWRDLHHQLSLVCKDLGMLPNKTAAPEDAVHQALLAGLLSHVGQRQQRREYLGARNRRFQLFPGSRLTKKPPPWLMATELVDTGTVYARINAAVQPDWIIAAAQHLVQRSYAEPQFSDRGQAVVAKEKVTLFGLVLSDSRSVPFANIDPLVAREIFIRSGLVEGGYRGSDGFWQHNCALLEELRDMEVRLRRPDVLADDEVLYQFYAEKLPSTVFSKASLDKWRKEAEREQPHILFMEREQVVRSDPGADVVTQFPDEWLVDGMTLPIGYSFTPGKEGDGVSITVPVAALNRLQPEPFEWLVPGLLREKCIELIKSLPRQLRKQLVPVPDTVDRILPELPVGQGSLYSALAAMLKQRTGVAVSPAAWQLEKLEPLYRMHFIVLDADGEIMANGRDLEQLRELLRPHMQQEIARAVPELSKQSYQRWDFEELPQSRVLQHGNVDVLVYPGLVDKGDSVAIEHCDSAGDAEWQTQQGLARLYMLALPQQLKYLKKQFLRGNAISLQMGQWFQRETLLDDYLLAVFEQHFVVGRDIPRQQHEFEEHRQSLQGGLVGSANEIHGVLEQIISHHHDIRSRLPGLEHKVWQYAVDDIEQQMQSLLGGGFMRRAGADALRQYPRYLRGIVKRIDKLAGHQQKDSQATEAIRPHIVRLQEIAGGQFENLPRSTLLRDYRWLLEEYRLSLFAQDIGARKPVSPKRLDKAWKRYCGE